MYRLLAISLATVLVAGDFAQKPAELIPPPFGEEQAQLPVAVRLQQSTVHLECPGKSEGSGVVFRDRSGGVWVWTVAHVVEDARRGQDDFGPVLVTLPNRGVVTARVVRYNAAEDIALLRLLDDAVPVDSVHFNRGPQPCVGTELYHVGSPTGSVCQGQVTTGIVSNYGRVIDGQVYGQSSTPIYGGSSGGAVCLRSSGYLVGLVSKGRGMRGGVSTICSYVPAWRIRAYARRTGVEFATDRCVKVPASKVIARGGIER